MGKITGGEEHSYTMFLPARLRDVKVLRGAAMGMSDPYLVEAKLKVKTMF